jgi:hypothetical protein
MSHVRFINVVGLCNSSKMFCDVILVPCIFQNMAFVIQQVTSKKG